MTFRSLSLIPTALLVAAATAACGSSDASPGGLTTDAEVMCEEFVERELDAAVEFSGTEAIVADAEERTYEVTGAVTHDGTSTSYACTVATDETGEEWTLQGLTFDE